MIRIYFVKKSTRSLSRIPRIVNDAGQCAYLYRDSVTKEDGSYCWIRSNNFGRMGIVQFTLVSLDFLRKCFFFAYRLVQREPSVEALRSPRIGQL